MVNRMIGLGFHDRMGDPGHLNRRLGCSGESYKFSSIKSWGARLLPVRTIGRLDTWTLGVVGLGVLLGEVVSWKSKVEF